MTSLKLEGKENYRYQCVLKKKGLPLYISKIDYQTIENVKLTEFWVL